MDKKARAARSGEKRRVNLYLSSAVVKSASKLAKANGSNLSKHTDGLLAASVGKEAA